MYMPPKAGSRHAPPHLERHGQGEYDEIKARWSARLLQLLHRHYPKTVGKVEFLDLSTPLTIEHYLGSYKGAGVGLDVTPQGPSTNDVHTVGEGSWPKRRCSKKGCVNYVL